MWHDTILYISDQATSSNSVLAALEATGLDVVSVNRPTQAIALLFERYQLKVYRFALRWVGNSATAEDIVSEVFIELWRHAASFEGRARLSTWILAIARNKAVSAMRRRIDQPLEDGMANAIPDHAGTAQESLEAADRSAVLRRCLAQLSPAHRFWRTAPAMVGGPPAGPLGRAWRRRRG